MKTAFAVLALCLASCSSSSSSPAAVDAGPACASSVAGSYSLLRKVDATKPNTCGIGDDKAARTVTIAADGTLTFQDTMGSCNGKIAGCGVTAKCQGTAAGGGALTLNITWTIDAMGFTGATALDEDSPRCEATYVDTATRTP